MAQGGMDRKAGPVGGGCQFNRQGDWRSLSHCWRRLFLRRWPGLTASRRSRHGRHRLCCLEGPTLLDPGAVVPRRAGPGVRRRPGVSIPSLVAEDTFESGRPVHSEVLGCSTGRRSGDDRVWRSVTDAGPRTSIPLGPTLLSGQNGNIASHQELRGCASASRTITRSLEERRATGPANPFRRPHRIRLPPRSAMARYSTAMLRKTIACGAGRAPGPRNRVPEALPAIRPSGARTKLPSGDSTARS